jgi:hypothetical protein
MNSSRYCSAAAAAVAIGCSEDELIARASLGLIRSRLDRFGWWFTVEVVQRLASEGLPEDVGDWRESVRGNR